MKHRKEKETYNDLPNYVPFIEAVYFFLEEYFDLDVLELGSRLYLDLSEKHAKRYGSGFIGDERFKEYCRRKVEFWREERNLL